MNPVRKAAVWLCIAVSFAVAIPLVLYAQSTGINSGGPNGGGGGTVASVGLTLPSVFSVAGSPVTGTGTLAGTFAGGQTQNQVLASPNGSSGAVGLRAIVTADLPAGTTPILSGTSGSIGGGALLAGACATGTATVTGATTAMVALTDPNTYPGDGTIWDAQVTSSNTVTVKVC